MQTDEYSAHRLTPEDGRAVPRRTTARLLRHPVHLVSLGFGSGLSPIAPGTAGTVFAWLSFIVLNPYLTEAEWGALIITSCLSGIWLTGYTARKLGTADPGPVVWDEIVAFWLVMLCMMPATFTAQLTAFLIFRGFDTFKPPPIGYLDQHLKGGLGIMLDDLAAAFMTLLMIALYRTIIQYSAI